MTSQRILRLLVLLVASSSFFVVAELHAETERRGASQEALDAVNVMINNEINKRDNKKEAAEENTLVAKKAEEIKKASERKNEIKEKKAKEREDALSKKEIKDTTVGESGEERKTREEDEDVLDAVNEMIDRAMNDDEMWERMSSARGGKKVKETKDTTVGESKEERKKREKEEMRQKILAKVREEMKTLEI
eukprot:CAMPEP_0201993330 /NCGR_PEP_ID=MMETSP0905-20130828/1601_1 /ASSEMBLY_ACC=CAM_ASM_000554 /TAXON_ID=420261 /ORGANISM="Thalassiosira antarctica, Strain CCMP982" /LENGTH=191 /DNA_ID=CAMNT_0048548169 /DNA_START=78 /DNA_END=653 /DNA_ORIENTATION=-